MRDIFSAVNVVRNWSSRVTWSVNQVMGVSVNVKGNLQLMLFRAKDFPFFLLLILVYLQGMSYSFKKKLKR